jgi:hypothetical protein
MTYYAQFSPDPPYYVIGFYDTSIVPYTNLPALDSMIVLSDAQWATLAGTVQTANQWMVSGGVMIAAPVPPPDPVLASQAALAQRIALGIGITSDSTPAVNATYALDSVSVGQIFQIGLYASQFGVFPSGQATQDYPDQIDPDTGRSTMHTFPVPVFVAFLKAVASLTSALNMQQALMAQGGEPAWPPQITDIV